MALKLPDAPESPLSGTGFIGRALFTLAAIKNPSTTGVALNHMIDQEIDLNKWQWEQGVALKGQMFDVAIKMTNLKIARANSQIAQVNAMIELEKLKQTKDANKTNHQIQLMDIWSKTLSNVEKIQTIKGKARDKSLELSDNILKNFVELDKTKRAETIKHFERIFAAGEDLHTGKTLLALKI